MRFLHPEYLVILALLWVAVRLGYLLRPISGTLWRRASYVVTALLVLAASRLQISTGEVPLAVMFVLDRSDSMAANSGRALEQVNGLASEIGRNDRAGLVVFGASAVLERGLASTLSIPETSSTIAASGTNIEAALRLAKSTLSAEGAGRIVLISDGHETAGSALAEAVRGGSGRIPIDVVLPSDREDGVRSLRVLNVAAPATVRRGEPLSVDVALQGPPGARVEVLLFRDGEAPVRRDIVLSETGYESVTFFDQLQRAGVVSYRASLRALDADPGAFFADDGRDAAGAVVSVSGQSNVLYISGAQGLLTSLLTANDFAVTELRPSSAPRSPRAMDGYDAVVLEDVPATALDSSQLSILAQHVEQRGAGLLVLGSQRSLEAATVMESPLGQILPVDLRPRSGRRAPGMALVLVFDKSGSMADRVGGVPKIELARQALAKVVDVVPATDALGVIAFDALPVEIASLGAGHDGRLLDERVRTIEPGGSTAIAPAVELARGWLAGPAGTAFQRRHVLLLSDGRSNAGDVAQLEAIVRRQDFELSVVALGADSDRALLTRLAQATGGRAYFPDNLRELPLIVAREAERVASGRVVEEPFVLRMAAHPVLAGITLEDRPRINGYVVGALKQTAENILTSHLEDPILAGWRVGLGRVAVYTADLHGPWSARMRAWNGAPGLWVASMRWLSKQADNATLEASFVEAGDQMHLVLGAQDPAGGSVNLLDSRARVRTPDGRSLDTTLVQSAPGEYSASIPLGEPGPYLVDFSAREPDTRGEHQLLRGFYWSTNAEHRSQGIDRANLAALAGATNGRVLGPGQSPFDQERQRAYVDTWPWLTTAALLLFVADILLRRITLSTFVASFVRRRRTSARLYKDAA
jgi:Mg-chelatase subunit ChlD